VVAASLKARTCAASAASAALKPMAPSDVAAIPAPVSFKKPRRVRFALIMINLPVAIVISDNNNPIFYIRNYMPEKIQGNYWFTLLYLQINCTDHHFIAAKHA